MKREHEEAVRTNTYWADELLNSAGARLLKDLPDALEARMLHDLSTVGASCRLRLPRVVVRNSKCSDHGM